MQNLLAWTALHFSQYLTCCLLNVEVGELLLLTDVRRSASGVREMTRKAAVLSGEVLAEPGDEPFPLISSPKNRPHPMQNFLRLCFSLQDIHWITMPSPLLLRGDVPPLYREGEVARLVLRPRDCVLVPALAWNSCIGSNRYTSENF